VIAGAQAVHNTKFFQLDGDAQASTKPAGVVSNGVEDWDTICAAHLQNPNNGNQPGPFCHPAPGVTLPSAATLADRSTFITDAFNATSDDIFKGGTDDGGIIASDGVSGSVWQWKQATPSPNKADIEQAFAAQYTCTAAKQAAGQCASGSDFLNHKYIFFGGTRFANNGDTNIGLWFFHKSVTVAGTASVTDPTTGVVSCPTTSGCGFTGGHTVGNCSLPTHPTPCTPGDLFVQSAFTSRPSIKIFEWVGPGNAIPPCITNACTLQPVSFTTPSGQTDNRCETTGTATVDQGCAIVNDQGEITSPWLFQDQSSKSPANKIESQELFEGGLDLTALGFGDECISTVLLNTRSSGSSVNSVAQDFALGQFGGCTSALSTTAAGAANNGSIGGGSVSSGTDSATLGINGVSSWTGTLTFYLCGPIASGTCNSNGVQVSTGTVTNATSQPISSASLQAGNNGTATLTSAGRYCWFASFHSNTNGVPDATDDGSANTPNAECFNVAPVTPTLTTHAVLNANGDPIPTGFKTPFGNPVFDTADLALAAKEPGTNGGNSTYPSINATNGAYAGTISFTLVGPDTASVDCSTTATGSGTNPQTVNVDTAVGNKTYGPVSFTPDHPGKFHWKATYTNTGSANNASPINDNGSCDQSREDVEIQQIPTTISTAQKVFPQDSATIGSSLAGDNLPAGGTVTFRLYGATGATTALQNCQAHGTSVGSGGLLYERSFSVAGGAPSATFDTDNQTVSINTNTTVYWRVTYATGDTAHTGRQSDCAESTQTTFVNDAGTGSVFP
jgi:hypothetical protein